MKENNEAKNQTGETNTPTHFIQNIITEDVAQGNNNGNVVTRFPPEPNGYLHIGHAKSICLNFGLARDFKGKCHLRLDDTNPCKENVEYIGSIKEDVAWLGFNWGDNCFFASDYFEQLYSFAIELIKKGKAYVCDLSAEEIREYRGTLTEPGKESPCRSRSSEENIELFQKMRAGEYANGEKTLRAKIDMTSGNLNMRDPVLYRILKVLHHRTGDKWCIYPMYDFTHCLSDSLEGITHSICTLEFEDHRPLYDWVLDNLETSCHPRQIEFARLNLTNTVMSKRKLLQLVDEKIVSGWDDPVMPTISGLRRRGYTPASIRNFCDRIGVAKRDSTVDMALLDFHIREDLNRSARRVMAVLRPLKLVIDNYPDAQSEELDAINNPEDPSMGTRQVPFSKTLYIEQEDFMEDAPKKYFRLTPGREVRLRYAYFVTCNSVVKDDTTGEITEIHCSYDPETRGGTAPDGRKVKSTIHWVSASHARDVEIRLYAHLLLDQETETKKDFKELINPAHLEVLQGCKAEPALVEAAPGDRFQFERQGYFCADTKDHTPESPVFNRIVTLRDTWKKIQNKNQKKSK
ncbi:MAG: glutamine--tRNA ligase/YqeY domain fusion protein [Fibrobacteria bacterium]|nr:glutamine--tRNA ligase/YqeY domain fusion protein [Fibrobacteria bacterium]